MLSGCSRGMAVLFVNYDFCKVRLVTQPLCNGVGNAWGRSIQRHFLEFGWEVHLFDGGEGLVDLLIPWVHIEFGVRFKHRYRFEQFFLSILCVNDFEYF